MIAEVDEMLVHREVVDGTNRVNVHTSNIGEVIEEAHQGPGTAHEGAKKVLERLVPSYYWPGMKKMCNSSLHPALAAINSITIRRARDRSST